MNLKKKVEDIFDLAAEPAVSIVSSMFLEGVVGSVVPGVTSAVLAYKQKRSEKMVEAFMLETKRRQTELEEKLRLLEEPSVEEITDKYFGLVLDYVTETRQEEKIKYIVNGFINLTEMQQLQEDVVITYYDILNDLNLLDITVLKVHDSNSDEDFYSVVQDANISDQMYQTIVNKLNRFGLLKNDAETDLIDGIQEIGDYLENKSRERFTGRRFSSPFITNQYRLTEFGEDFLQFFNEEID